jgi:hypothetical protein
MTLKGFEGYYPDNCCQVCGWPLKKTLEEGCVRIPLYDTWWHNCSMLPTEDSRKRCRWIEAHPWTPGAGLRNPPARPFIPVKDLIKARIIRAHPDVDQDVVEIVVDFLFSMTLWDHLASWLTIKINKTLERIDRRYVRPEAQ